VILEKEIECLRDELRKTTKKNYRIVSQILPLQKLVKSKRDALEKIKNALHKNGQKLNNLLAVIAHCNSEAKEIACKRISSADEDDDSFDTASSDSSSCDHNYHSYDELANEINQLNTSIEEFEIENDMFSGEIDTMQKQIDGINVYFTEVDRIVHTPDMLVKEKIKVLTQMAEATILFVSKLERT
jgi:chromosome segregation ATPase